MKYALIGGTGVDPSMLQDLKIVEVNTPYGEVELQEGSLNDLELVFLSRHGSGHSIPPHRINYRANIWALKSIGVTRIIATNAVVRQID